MKNELKSLNSQLDALKKDTDSLKSERTKLLNDLDYLEEYARNVHKMKKDNEDIFLFVK